MNIWVFLVGVSVGWGADRLYNAYIIQKKYADKDHADEDHADEDSEDNKAIETKVTKNDTIKAEVIENKPEEKDIAVENIKKENIKKEKAKKKEKEKPKARTKNTKKDSAEEIRDDLTQIKGIGPKVSKALYAMGIYNYEQLSSAPVDSLLKRLQETGGRFNKTTLLAIMERAKKASKER